VSIQQANAARLEHRIQRLGGDYARCSVRYVHSPRALAGEAVTWAGEGFYLHDGAGWSFLGSVMLTADARVREMERDAGARPDRPTASEVFGVVVQVATTLIGIVRDIARR